MNKTVKIVSTTLKIVLPLVILAGGAFVARQLVTNRPEPQREVKRDLGALVRLLKVVKGEHQVIVSGTGSVQSAQEVTVIPQLSGRVTYAAPSFVTGGFFKKGALMFEIDDTDYRLALEQAKAARAKAEYDLTTIDSQARVARMEWDRLDKGENTEPNPLVFFEPQLKNARAALNAAFATIEQAKEDLKRTRIRAPFNCRVRSESIDPGQYVRTGTGVAVIAGTDRAEVIVPLTLDDLKWLQIPHPKKTVAGSTATVKVKAGREKYEWRGRIVRSTGEVDPKSRMMQIVVAVEDPYGLKGTGENPDVTLAAGTFVEVSFAGKKLRNVIPIPRDTLREDSTVWVMDEEEILRIKKVAPLRVEADKVLVGKGLDNGDLLILTTLSGAAEGMRLRPVRE